MSFVKHAIYLSAALLALTTQVEAHTQHKTHDQMVKTTPMTVLQHWALGAASKWDYAAIDTTRHHLFVTQGDHVNVLELPSGKLLTQIPSHGAHGVAFAQNLKLGFISNGASNSVTVFDLDTLQPKQDTTVSGVNPDAILYDAASQKLYTFNGKSADISVIDPQTMKVLTTIAATGRPEFAVEDGNGKIFFNIEDKAEVGVIDISSDKLVTTWPLKNCEEPSGLAIDSVHKRLFSVCQNKTMIITDAQSGQQVATAPIGEHPDAAYFDVQTNTIYSSNGAAGGSLTAIHQRNADHYSVTGNYPTAQGARTMAMDSVTQTIYLPTANNGEFEVLVVGAQQNQPK
ncbi:YncE family protein [Aquirhabdus sp.]|uniref:YncE family protein n=1 Tax=Aquirhabdus sp. TaxID=2824160 RepID=UPI00396CF70D